MSLTHWLSKHLWHSSQIFGTASRLVSKRRVLAQQKVRPCVECLEERWLMSSTLAVTNSDDLAAERGTLRWAVANAKSGDTILLTPALQSSGITLTQGELILSQPGVTIKSVGKAPTTISGGNLSRIFEVAPGASVTLSNLLITGGNGLAGNPAGVTRNRGGALLVDPGAALTISDCTLTGNSIAFGGSDGNPAGGAVYNAGTLTVIASTVTNNFAIFAGGGLCNIASMTVSNSSLSGNSASFGGGIFSAGITTISDTCVLSDNVAFQSGGGIYTQSDSMTANGSTLSGNSAKNGGGIYNDSTATTTVNASTLSDNTASTGSGGGIFNSGTLTIRGHSALTGNSANAFGGAIGNFGIATVNDSTLLRNQGSEGGGVANWDIFGFGILTVSNTQLSQNTATNVGGAFFNQSGGVAMSNCALSDNVAANNGGGIYTVIGGSFDVSDCTLSHNSATSGSGGGIFNTSTMSVGSSNLSDNSAGFAGGGIFNFATLTVSNSTFTGNSAVLNGGGIYTSNDLGGFVSGITTINGSTFTSNTPDNIFGDDYFGGGNTFA